MEKTQTMKMHLREKDVMGTNDDERYGVLMTPHLHVVVSSSCRRRTVVAPRKARFKEGGEGRREGGKEVLTFVARAVVM
jgi:hypothetical protein